MKSKYHDREYLEYLQYKHKFEGKTDEGFRDSQDAVGLREVYARGKELDEELEGVGREGRKKKGDDQIEILVRKWKENKKVLGIKDSSIEQRIQQLLNLLEGAGHRRNVYINDMNMFKQKLDDTKAVSSGNIVRIKEIEDIIIQRDILFEKENKLISNIQEMRRVYMRIKDYEFEGGSAPKELYEDIASRIQSCEYDDELISIKRNQLLNNFETVSNDMFLKYFSQRAKINVYDNKDLEDIVKASALRSNKLKMELRDLPNQLIDERKIDQWMKEAAESNNKKNERLVLVSNKQGDTLQDKSMIVTGIRKNMQQYGVKDGLKISNASLIPESILKNL